MYEERGGNLTRNAIWNRSSCITPDLVESRLNSYLTQISRRGRS